MPADNIDGDGDEHGSRKRAVPGCTVDRLGCGAIGRYQQGFFSGYNPCGRSVTDLQSAVTTGSTTRGEKGMRKVVFVSLSLSFV